MLNKQRKNPSDPKVILLAAIEELDVFTQPEASSLHMDEDGRLIAAKESPLKKVVGLARSFIGPLFSEQVRQKQEKKIGELKQALLQARDIIQSHSGLIEKFKEGDDSQRKLAEYALAAIQRYNAVIRQKEFSRTAEYEVYNYERRCLLSDNEIRGQPIVLPHTLSVKYDSHPNVRSAQQRLKELSEALQIGAAGKKSTAAISSTHKKTIQFMIDTFRMKAIRLLQTHLKQYHSMSEILELVKGTSLQIDDETDADFISMQQLLEAGPGFFVIVSGCFKRNSSDSKFLTMPLLDSFKLSFQVSHSGFPYPAQHHGWALSDKWVEASPLRGDRTPLFQKMEQRRKQLIPKFLSDDLFIQEARQKVKLKREIFDQNRALFLPLHRQLQNLLKESFSKEEESVLEAFYHDAAHAPSSFDVLVQTQQRLLDFFIKQPITALEEEWLGTEETPLRTGSPQEKLHAVCTRLEQHRQNALQCWNPNRVIDAYIMQQGVLLGGHFQMVALQYQSEKIGFSPPSLNDFERKLQALAFQQLSQFMEECEKGFEAEEPEQIKNNLLSAWTQDLKCTEGEQLLPWAIVNELEGYFRSRPVFSPRY